MMIRTLVLLILFSYSAMAQTDYLITSKADTLYGDLRILTYDHIDRVQIEVDKKKEVLTAIQVLSLYKDGEVYKPLKYDTKIVFMKALKQGYLSMYAFRLPNQSSYDGRLLTKMDGTSIEVPNLGFKKILSNYLEECSSVAAQVKEGELSRKEIEKIIDDFNACLDTKNTTASIPDVSAPVVNEVTQSIESLIKKVDAAEFSSKKDALDLLRDIQTKVAKNETIPNYLSEGLKSYLSSVPALSDDLEKLLSLLKK
jgi:hypothetical protein